MVKSPAVRRNSITNTIYDFAVCTAAPAERVVSNFLWFCPLQGKHNDKYELKVILALREFINNANEIIFQA